MATTTANLHIFFLPLLAPGHMIPMVDLAILLSARVARSTIVTTPANAELIRPSLAAAENIHLIAVPLISDHGILVSENITALPVPDVTPDFFASLCHLEPHLDRLLIAHRPDCIVSDVYFPWTAALAKCHQIPRIAFHGSSYFCSVLVEVLTSTNIHNQKLCSDMDEPFLVPCIPHSIKLTRSQLPEFLTSPSEIMALISASFVETYGLVMNTFYELEPDYADYGKGDARLSRWNVGPVSLCRRSFGLQRTRGGSTDIGGVFGWLEGKEAGSVLYVCFGSLPRFTAAQFGLIRDGLKAAGRPFVWVVRDEPAAEGISADSGEEGGFVIKGWAPQIAILMHEAVGGFMTHCGWNSCLEGISAGVPMVTWPLFADQSFNERLLVDVLGLGVDVGSRVNSLQEEKRTMVAAERVAAAVEAIMGDGVEAARRRERARDVRKLAEAAMAEGGSSEVALGRMVEELVALKIAKMKEAT